ncbi:hypothetical protein [Mycetocola sp. JXN-3]|uniref:hypothetical protein n=1 Tax=Mycetocola sp. JXN-3 TaxID=2116510 RepID=UPI00165D0EB2|nr:hypothetical protein [Mycetocola sp. JXN-3]
MLKNTLIVFALTAVSATGIVSAVPANAQVRESSISEVRLEKRVSDDSPFRFLPVTESTPREAAKIPAVRFTAKQFSHSNATKTAVIGGTGVPGSAIHLSLNGREHRAWVRANGLWSVTIAGLEEGPNTVSVVQIRGGVSTPTLSVPVRIVAIPGMLTAGVNNVNNPGRWANISGTAVPGARVVATSPGGTATGVRVSESGTFQVRAQLLEVGSNTVVLTQERDGIRSAPVRVIVHVAEASLTAPTIRVGSRDGSTVILDGAGVPGALITLSTRSGVVTTRVSVHGTWKKSIVVPGDVDAEVVMTQGVGANMSDPQRLSLAPDTAG